MDRQKPYLRMVFVVALSHLFKLVNSELFEVGCVV
jgi:hypothetical protein